MAKKNEYHPQTVPHPGIDLEEKLEELGMGPLEFAVRTGKPEKTIHDVLNGRSAITPDMAVQFENALGIPAHYWLQRQRSFDESMARQRQREVIADSTDWAKCFPLKAMMVHGWIPSMASLEERTLCLLAFFGVSNSDSWKAYYMEEKLKTAFRISLKHTQEPYAISAWLRKGELQAKEQVAAVYDESIFKKKLLEIKSLMAKHPADFFPKLQKLCAQAGVRVVYTPQLPKAPISGSTRWMGDSPLIQLTGRYKRNDSFWFTFFHEAGHILLHGKKDVFLESIEWDGRNDAKEREADAFAVKWTFTDAEEQEVLESAPLNENDIRRFAHKFNTHPAMIIGRLQHKRLIPFSLGRSFLEPVELAR
jgi:HTH-type transcriptional regulator/antitoxin HigA